MRTKDQWMTALQTIEGGYVTRGGIEHMYSDSFRSVSTLIEHGMVKDGDAILDIGCANGSLAIAFSEMDVSYTGIDCTDSAIRFCNRVFADYPNFSFIHLNILNEQYNPEGSLLPTPETIAFPDGPFDLVIARSLFTHLETPYVCTLYIEEIQRVLRRGGKFFSSWFRSPPHEVNTSANKTVLREADIINLLKGFHKDVFQNNFMTSGEFSRPIVSSA